MTEENNKIVVDLEESVKLTPEEQTELNKIMSDNYSKGAFIGMCTNLFFSKMDTDNILGFDRIVKIALAARINCYKMAGKEVPKPVELQKKEPVKLVM